MFRKKVAVKAEPPSPSPFLLRHLHLSPPSSQILDTLCWKLSRSLNLSCFLLPSSPTCCLLYKPSQSHAAAEAIRQIADLVPIDNVGEEEEAMPGSLLAKAVECGLRSFLLGVGWRCVGENCFVKSDFSPGDEGRHLHAFTVSVQIEITGEFLFLVRPDVIRFSRYQISDLIDSKSQQKLSDSEEIKLDEGYGFAPSCSVLPSLFEGHVTGLQKLLPAGMDLPPEEESWLVKHGLELSSEYFINVLSSRGGCTNSSWFPSSFVIQGAGFSPAPQSIRILEALRVLQSFMAHIEKWDFFNEGQLKIKGIVSSPDLELLTWTTAADSIRDGLVSQNSNPLSTDLFAASDFRTPKPVLLPNVNRAKRNNVNSASLANEDFEGVPASSTNETAYLSASDNDKLGRDHQVPVKGSVCSDSGTAKPALVPNFRKKVRKIAGKKTAQLPNKNVQDAPVTNVPDCTASTSTTSEKKSLPTSQAPAIQGINSENKQRCTRNKGRSRNPASKVDNGKSTEQADTDMLVKDIPIQDIPACSANENTYGSAYDNDRRGPMHQLPVTESVYSDPGTAKPALVPNFRNKNSKIAGAKAARLPNKNARNVPVPSVDGTAFPTTSKLKLLCVPQAPAMHGINSDDLVVQSSEPSDLENELRCTRNKGRSRNPVSKVANGKRTKQANADMLVKDVPSTEDTRSVLVDGSILPKISEAQTIKEKEACAGTRKRTSTRENQEDPQDIPKKKAKPQTDSSDGITKVIDHHKRGQLESVTVADLKAFLSSRKAKVGGKKEELIQRVNSLLD